MLAGKESTGPTMLGALAITSNALDAAVDLDMDRSAEDRLFFKEEKVLIDAHFDKVEAAERAVNLYILRQMKRCQARVEVGDVVLDRGTRRGKKRVALEVDSATADEVFGEDISEIVDAELHVEPILVTKCVDRLAQSGDFAGKAALITDLTTRADQQKQNFAERTAADVTLAALESALDKAIAQGADGLYALEKRLLERFPRQRVYVRAFFWDAGWKKKPKNDE